MRFGILVEVRLASRDTDSFCVTEERHLFKDSMLRFLESGCERNDGNREA